MSQGRSILKTIVVNFINSIKPRRYWGNLIGKDHFGTEYFETPNKTRGKTSRWFVPRDNSNFEQELPVEWQAWLRHKRKYPPTEEEIFLNAQKKEQTVENARLLETPKTISVDEIKPVEKPTFPKYEEYEVEPGATRNTKKQL